MPTLIIDNQSVTVADGSTIIEAAQQLGIVVPHFCYHRALGAVGACRMCAVTVVEGSQPGLKMSCMTPVEEGMVVATGSQAAAEFRKHVAEWLMTNHPHDCPVCDEGGECQLQEMTIAAGHGIRSYRGRKRTFLNQDLGPYVVQEMNRCIQCYCCARTYRDYCGGRDFGVLGSRQRVFFGRFRDGMLESDFSGNIIDVCPTGVLTDKTFRFKTRLWDLEQAPSICPHCSLGCATVPGGRYQELQRVTGGINPRTNGHFICDRGRFGSAYVNHPQRPRQARAEGTTLPLPQAIESLRQRIEAIIREHGAAAVALVGSGRASLEANLLLKQWAGVLHCAPPVFELHPRRSRAVRQTVGALSGQLASLEQVRQSDLIVVFGADPLAEGPMLALALRQAVRNGGRVVVLDPRPVELPCAFEHQPLTQEQILRLLAGRGEGDLFNRLLMDLMAARQPVLVGGGDLLGGAGLQLLGHLTESCDNQERLCLVHPLLPRANSFGAGLLEGAEQSDLLERLESGRIKALVCLEADPCSEHPEAGRMQLALSRLDYLAVFDYLPTHAVKRADLLLPTATPVEGEGVLVNNEGRMQAFAPVLQPGIPLSRIAQGDHPPREFFSETPGSQPRPAWRLLQQLLGDERSLAELRRDAEQAEPRLAGLSRLQAGDEGQRVAARNHAPVEESTVEIWAQNGELRLLPVQARYGSDAASRFSDHLLPRLTPPGLLLHPREAASRNLRAGETVVLKTAQGSFRLKLVCDERMVTGRAVVACLAGTPLEVLVPGGLSLPCDIEAEAP
ncbi:MAG TPA: NADH-quinone oxidoreductase subunit NuoG [Geopsychrobacteraceae bacterium]